MKSSTVPVIVFSCVILLLCCLCSSLLVYGVFTRSITYETSTGTVTTGKIPTQDPIIIRPEARLVESSSDTLAVLENTDVPQSNLAEIAQRFKGLSEIPSALDPISSTLGVGAVDHFWVTDTDNDENFRIIATLRLVTEHAYFWIQDGIRYDEEELITLGEVFENQIYPTNHDYFGSEWTPGIDGDPHLYIIYAKGLGRSLAGYFSSSDVYHNLVHEYSNMHETFMLNADNLALDENYTFGVLAHEFQHMIHWNQDRNEDGWVNEGLSELASYVNGYDIGGFDALYAMKPDMQLNDWPINPADTAPHYGASFLFTAYFLDRFGIQGIRALTRHPANGLAGVDGVLAELGVFDPLESKPIHADDVFLDWTLATYLNDEDIADGRYRFYGYDGELKIDETEIVDSCPTGVETRDIHQYGVDYIRINCTGNFKLQFQGATNVNLLPVEPFSGRSAYWSNKGDDSDMTLTKIFDFRDHVGPLTLSYWTWYDLEEDYDYVYLTVSIDGKYWEILQTPSGTSDDPSGNSFGWAYNGFSGKNGSWIRESVDLSPYKGKKIQLRFEYVTDGAVNGEGFLLDDLSIPEIGYFTDFETAGDGWEAAGFVRIQNSLPQTFRLALIENGNSTQVEDIELGEENQVEVPVNIENKTQDVILVVTATNRFTRQVATYQYQLSP
jgi:hypothetical protein